MSIPKPIVQTITVCCVLAALLVWASVPALAGSGFAAPTTCSPPGGFEGPIGVAVDGSSSITTKGDFYVTDEGHHTIDQFTPACELLTMVEIPGVTLGQLTVQNSSGPTEGDVYVAGQSNGAIYRFGSGLTGETELIKGLSEPTDVTVDEKGDILVTELAGGEGKILEFNAAGEPIDSEGKPDANNTIIQALSGPQGLAINQTGNELYVATGSGTIKYTLTGKTYTAAAEPLDAIESHAVTVAPSGDVYVDQDERGLGEIEQYGPAGSPLLNKFGLLILSGSAYGVGINEESHDVYVADRLTDKPGEGEVPSNAIYVFEEGATPEAPERDAASEVHGFTALLHGTLKSGGNSTGYYFEYNTGTSCEGGSRTNPGIATEGTVQSEAIALQPHTQYSFCLVATNKYGSTVGSANSFETQIVAPAIENETITTIGVHGATVHAGVNPENVASRYYVEYGTDSTFATNPGKTPEVSIGEGAAPEAVSAQLTDLEPNTEYHFRIVATNTDDDTGLGPEISFTTLPTGTAELPDNRVYEMVTPREDGNSDVMKPELEKDEASEYRNGIPTYDPFQVAPDGSAITYPVLAVSGSQGSEVAEAGDQYLAERSQAGGWTQASIQPVGYTGTVYEGFSSDLSTGILHSGNIGEAEILPALIPDAPGEGYKVLYYRSNNTGVYHAFVTRAMPLNRDPASSGNSGLVRDGYAAKSPVFAGATADFSDALFEMNDSLLVGEGTQAKELERDVKAEIAEGKDTDYLYDQATSGLSVIDVSPEGGVVPNATFGAGSFNENVLDPPDFSHVISSDGSRVYWTALSSGVVYVREDPNGVSARTVQVSAHAARYWTASTDGRYAFYTEGEGRQSELYRFDGSGESGAGRRESLTAASAGVLGVLGASEDGEIVYFVAEGVLAGANGRGASPVEGKPNLYVLRHGSAPVFVATLSEQDGKSVPPYERKTGPEDWGDWQPGFGQRTARVTGDGGGVVFMSNQSLGVVGYPHDYPSNGLDEVYVYEDASNRLYCASCGSTGESLSGGKGAAAFLPVDWSDTYLFQWISEDGNRVFFDTSEPLVAQDTNGAQDVYEWEREGHGSCTHGAGTTGGCVFLLSGGTSRANSWFVGASINGSDVFIVTRAQLVAEDENDIFYLYDVRENGVKPVTPPVCTGSGCQGVPAPPPTFATPPSVTYNGIGNFPNQAPVTVKPKVKIEDRAQKLASALHACEKQRNRKRRAQCETKAKRRYGAAKESRNGIGGRGHHA
jgi:hypothetical protein